MNIYILIDMYVKYRYFTKYKYFLSSQTVQKNRTAGQILLRGYSFLTLVYIPLRIVPVKLFGANHAFENSQSGAAGRRD